MSDEPLAKIYEPKAVEEKWYPVWLDRKYFHADDKSESKKPFSLVIPPPNVTGSLHMGHALNVTLQDIVARFWRMRGANVCWIPGTDHAGIATQNVVEKQLHAEGTDRHALGRDAFIERIWQWKKQYGDRIVHQLKRLGASCDWERERFTMDEGLSRAVREVFIHLHEDGLIYRGEYLINWCPRCLTALSDLEVEHEEVAGHLWHIRYPVVTKDVTRDTWDATTMDVSSHVLATEGSERPTSYVVVATTRPETMLGDTAVAVHPDDERYAALIGTAVRLPLCDREIPVIADHRVDRAFGTGAVKVTPAHDLNDFQLGNDHKLTRINIFTPTATINEHGGAYQGLDRFAARKKVVEDVEAQGLLVKVDDHRHNVGHCYRCKTIVEPYLSKQWFVKVGPLAEKAVGAVRQGRTKFVPSHWTKTYYDWMDRIQDWCISRQIWWGHRIPAWYCSKTRDSGPGTRDQESTTDCPPIVSREAPAKCACGATEFTQDPDVLDTWFSSALWPFSTLGWPDHTQALKTLYPTSVLVTGFDIIFFWVARMMMMGLRFMGDVPFKTVYIHALVRDPLGQKMSKSKGNVIDPLEVMDRHGTDAFRFTLAALAAQGRDIKMSEERVEGYRNFCNKLWNAARFIFMQEGACAVTAEDQVVDAATLSLADKWITNRLQQVVRAVTKAVEGYEFDAAARTLYQFTWHEFCDWYIETAKPRLRPEAEAAGRKATLVTLMTTFETMLRLLHPFMPFITEEIWQQLQHEARSTKHEARSIVIAPWPIPAKHPQFAKEAKTFQLIADIVSAIRTIRSEHHVSPAKRVTALVRTTDAAAQKILGTHGAYLRELARLDRLELRVAPVREGPVAAAIVGTVEVYLPLTGLIDIDAERARLQKEIERTERMAAAIRAKLGGRDFVERAPAEVVAEERERMTVAEAQLIKLREAVERLGSVHTPLLCKEGRGEVDPKATVSTPPDLPLQRGGGQ